MTTKNLYLGINGKKVKEVKKVCKGVINVSKQVIRELVSKLTKKVVSSRQASEAVA